MLPMIFTFLLLNSSRTSSISSASNIILVLPATTSPFLSGSFQDGKRCLTQSELYPVAIDNFYIKSDIAIEFLRPLQIADINPAGIYSFNLHSYRVLFPHSVQTLSCNETMPPHSMQVYRAECIFRKLHIPSSLTISLFSTGLSL